MAVVCQIFRSKKRNRFSVENAFQNIKPYIEEQYNIEERYLPEAKYFSIPCFTKNVIYTLKSRGDIFHITGESYFCAFFTPRRKTVLTILDYVAFEKARGISRILIWLLMYYLPIKHSRFVTCISKKTYDDTLKLFPWAKRRLSVVPVSISDEYVRKDKEFNCGKPIILVVGTTPHKNLDRTIDALEGMNCVLDIVGKLSDEQRIKLQKKHVEYTQSENLTNEEVVRHYEECDIVSFCSTYEGFGMPVVEGQAVGRVVVTSDIDPMNVVAGNGAHFVNPFSTESIRAGIEKVILDKEYRDTLINNGFSNCEKYRNENVANLYKDLYRKICI